MNDTLTMSREHAIESMPEIQSAEPDKYVPNVQNGAFSDKVRVLSLSPRDQMTIAEALLNPPPLNNDMKKALRERLIDMYGPGN